MSGALYYLRLLVFRQTALAPVLVFLGIVGAIYESDAGPPVPAASVTAAALMPVTAWLTRLVASAESPPFGEITLVAMGGSARRLFARGGAVMAVCAGLTGISMCWAVLANPHPYSATALGIIAGMSLAQGIAGFGLGSLIVSPMRAGAAVVVVVGVVIASLVIRGLPPLNPTLRLLGMTPLPSASLVFAGVVQAAALGLVLAGVALVLRR